MDVKVFTEDGALELAEKLLKNDKDIKEELEQKGYATEALKAFLEYIKEEHKLEYVIGVCLKDNIASSKVMEKVGFVKTFDGIASYQGEDRPIYRYIYRFI